MGTYSEVNDKYTVLFDGVCNLCNASILFIIDRDKKNKFVFAPLQSEVGAKLLKDWHVTVPPGFDSVVVFKNNKVYKKSEAALEVVKELTGLWPLLYVFKILPATLRDFFYDLVAKNRYKLFGKSNSCRIPTPELKQKFLA